MAKKQNLKLLYTAQGLTELGRLEQEQGNLSEAKDAFTKALNIYQQINFIEGEATVLRNLGILCDIEGQYNDGLVLFKQALSLHRTLGDTASEGRTLGNIGVLLQEQGNYQQALEQYRLALQIHRQVGDRILEEKTLCNVGNVFSLMNQKEEALQTFYSVLEMGQKMESKITEGIVCGNIGYLHYELNQFTPAKEMLRRAVDICEGAVVAAAGVFRGTLALILAKEGDTEEALIMLTKSEQEVQGEPVRLARVFCAKARVLLMSGRENEGWETLAKAQRLASDLNITNTHSLVQTIEEIVQEFDQTSGSA